MDWRIKSEIDTLSGVAVRTCKVTYADLSNGIEHTVQVSAQSLFEAVAQALRIFREHDWCGHDLRGSAATLTVKIAAPEIEHLVRVSDFQGWLEGQGRSPAEMVLKGRLRDILGPAVG